MHQHNFVLNCSQWVTCRGMWIWMACVLEFESQLPRCYRSLVLRLPSKTAFLHLCMAPTAHLVSYTQSNLFGSQTPMSHSESGEERILLLSNQWNITTLDKLNQYCSKYWTLRWWRKKNQLWNYVHNSSAFCFLRLEQLIKTSWCLDSLQRLTARERRGCPQGHPKAPVRSGPRNLNCPVYLVSSGSCCEVTVWSS